MMVLNHSEDGALVEVLVARNIGRATGEVGCDFAVVVGRAYAKARQCQGSYASARQGRECLQNERSPASGKISAPRKMVRKRFPSGLVEALMRADNAAGEL